MSVLFSFSIINPACCAHVDDEREKEKKRNSKIKRRFVDSFVSRSI